MKSKSNALKVAVDLFLEQMGWTLWFLGILLIIHVVRIFNSIYAGKDLEHFFLSSYYAADIYMLVIGIIIGYGFYPFFVKHGVTRKDVFRGGVLAAGLLSAAIVLTAAVITAAEYSVVNIANLPLHLNSTLEFTEGVDDDVIGNLVLLIVLGPLVDFSSHGLLSLFVYMTNIFTSYVIGWFISAVFYRYGWTMGLGSIVLATLFFLIRGLVWGGDVARELAADWVPPAILELPLYGSVAGTIVLIGGILWLIRLLTQRVTIKL